MMCDLLSKSTTKKINSIGLTVCKYDLFGYIVQTKT